MLMSKNVNNNVTMNPPVKNVLFVFFIFKDSIKLNLDSIAPFRILNVEIMQYL